MLPLISHTARGSSTTLLFGARMASQLAHGNGDVCNVQIGARVRMSLLCCMLQRGWVNEVVGLHSMYKREDVPLETCLRTPLRFHRCYTLPDVYNGTHACRPRSQVFLAGATGRLGARILRALLEADPALKVRAAARDTARGQAFLDTAVGIGALPGDAARRVSVVEVDLTNADDIRAAIGGASKVLSVCRLQGMTRRPALTWRGALRRWCRRSARRRASPSTSSCLSRLVSPQSLS